ncbi:unnamed protein product [Tenebrio molitor]|nr:unnamed protein product [Tenebrio molitor]
MKAECGKEPRFVCQVKGCPYRTRIKNNLKIHIINRHPEIVDGV